MLCLPCVIHPRRCSGLPPCPSLSPQAVSVFLGICAGRCNGDSREQLLLRRAGGGGGFRSLHNGARRKGRVQSTVPVRTGLWESSLCLGCKALCSGWLYKYTASLLFPTFLVLSPALAVMWKVITTCSVCPVPAQPGANWLAKKPLQTQGGRKYFMKPEPLF